MRLTYRIYYGDGSTVESPTPWEDAPSEDVQIVVIWRQYDTPQRWDGLDGYWSDGEVFGGFLDMPPFEEVAASEQKAGRLKRGTLISDEAYARIVEEAAIGADNPPSA